LLGNRFMSPRDFKCTPTPAALLCLSFVGNQATHLPIRLPLSFLSLSLCFPFGKRSTELSSEDVRLLAFGVHFWNIQRALRGTLLVVWEIFVIV